MSDDQTSGGAKPDGAAPQAQAIKPEDLAANPDLEALPAPARRALEEAAERRQREAAEAKQTAKETGGPKGKEPTRYGDWEKNGRAIDFS